MMHRRRRVSNPPRTELLHGLSVVFLSVMLVTLGFAALNRANQFFALPVFALAAAAGLGIVSGFSARWALRQRANLLRGLTALAIFVFGLGLLGWITQGQSGIQLQYGLYTDPDWFGLAQIVVGAATIWVALQAWRAPSSPRTRVARPRREPAQPQPTAAQREHIDSRELEESPRHRRSATNGQREPEVRVSHRAPHRSLVPTLESWRARMSNTTISRWWQHLPRVPNLKYSPPRWVQRLRSRIRLVGAEEHRCPFCLELVKPNDPRGVKVCSICHAHHHADCWAVTGMCQVPHHHH